MQVQEHGPRAARAAQLRRTLVTFQRPLLVSLAIGLAFAGGVELILKIWRLAGPQREIDLRASSITVLYRVTLAWFEGEPVYTFPNNISLYPPATWLLLWPTYSWLTFDQARLLWTFINLAALAALCLLCARAMSGQGRLASLCAGLAPLSVPAMADSFGIGQLTIVVLPLTIGAVVIAARTQPTWWSDAAAAALFVVALMKPNLTAPFFLPLVIVSRRIRLVAFVIFGYAVLTYAASLAQPVGLVTQIRDWLRYMRGVAGEGYGNLQSLLIWLEWPEAFFPLVLALVIALAAWVWWCRRSDVWILLAVAAIVARLWTYHRVYDDAVLLIPVIALARMVGRDTDDVDWLQDLAVLIGFAAILWIPLQFHYAGSTLGAFTVTRPWTVAFNMSHTVAAVAALVYLARRGVHEAASLSDPHKWT